MDLSHVGIHTLEGPDIGQLARRLDGGYHIDSGVNDYFEVLIYKYLDVFVIIVFSDQGPSPAGVVSIPY